MLSANSFTMKFRLTTLASKATPARQSFFCSLLSAASIAGFVFLVVTVLTTEVSAAIGETPDQIAARYGQPTDTNFMIDDRCPISRGCLYRKNDVRIVVVFYEGKSAFEHYQKVSRTLFSDDEAKILLHDGTNAEWTVVDTSTPEKIQYRAATLGGEELDAVWYKSPNARCALEIKTAVYAHLLYAEVTKAKKDAERLQDSH